MREVKKLVKTYISINDLFYSTEVVLRNGERHRVSFEHGIKYPYRLNGRYTTDDEEVQHAVEHDNGFGIKFKLHNVSEKIEIVGGIEEAPVEAPKQVVGIKEFEADEVFTDAYSANEVREILIEKFGAEVKPIRSLNAMLLFAKEKSIAFPNAGKPRE